MNDFLDQRLPEVPETTRAQLARDFTSMSEWAARLRTELSQRGAHGVRVHVRRLLDTLLISFATNDERTSVEISEEDCDRMMERLPYHDLTEAAILSAALQMDSAVSLGVPL